MRNENIPPKADPPWAGEKMDQELMRASKELREKEVSEGMLKGFSASVERRILARKQDGSPKRFLLPALVPALAVMMLASLVVLRSPMVSTPQAPQSLDYAQLDAGQTDIEEDIAALKEIGAWSEEDESVIGATDEAIAQELELSSSPAKDRTNIA